MRTHVTRDTRQIGFVLGVSGMAAATSFGTLMAGRVVVGLGVGFGIAADPVYKLVHCRGDRASTTVTPRVVKAVDPDVPRRRPSARYIAEIAPAAHRGALVTWAEIGVNVGIVGGFLAGCVPPL